MTPYQKRLSAITKRMADDMKTRNLAQATIDAYTYHVGKFAEFFGKPLEQATPEDVRGFQLHLMEVRKVGWDGNGWRNSQRRDVSHSSDDYLVDAVNLRRAYRDHFLASLDQLREKGQLKLQDDYEHLLCLLQPDRSQFVI